MSVDPAWLAQARAQWTWRGTTRPPFAIAPGPGQESVWDYPRPPALVPDPRAVTVRLGDVSIASAPSSIRLLETSHPPTYYVPRAAVAMQHLVDAGRASMCEWKGACTYYDVVIGDRTLARAAWSYEEPFPEAAAIAGHLAFYAHDLACTVGGERVRPQPGGFYGGWITTELVGPFKGEPGTSGW